MATVSGFVVQMLSTCVQDAQQAREEATRSLAEKSGVGKLRAEMPVHRGFHLNLVALVPWRHVMRKNAWLLLVPTMALPFSQGESRFGEAIPRLASVRCPS